MTSGPEDYLTDITQPNPAYQTQRRPRQRRRAGGWRGLLTGFALTSAILIGVLGAIGVVGAYGYYQFSGLILPGVRVGDVTLGNMTVEEATRSLNQRWNGGGSVTLTDGRRAWVAPAAEFGLTLDAAATAQRAHGVGRNTDALSELLALFDSSAYGTTITPAVSINVETARTGLRRWANVVNVPPQNPALRLEGGQVVAAPGVTGRSLDVEATLANLSANPGATFANGSLPLVMVQVAPPQRDVTPAIAEAERMLDSDLAIEAYDPITDERVRWVATRETIASWLTVDDGPSVVVDAGRLEAYLTDLNATLGAGRSFDPHQSAATIQSALQSDATAVALVVKHTPTAYTVQPGDTLTGIGWDTGIPVWRILEANPGLDANSLSVGEVLTIPSPDDLLPLPVVVNKRIVVSIDQQRLWAYENGALRYDFVISTGIDRSPTQPGVFQVQTHDPSAYAALWDLTMPNFLGIYEAWPGFMNGFHGLPTLSNGQILWANILGRPASYGCIILDLPDAETLYNWAEDGVVVEITA